jgi:hypothetical protein
MTDRPHTLDALKIRNAAAHARFLAAVVARSEAELTGPRLPGGWSVKDVLGHLAWWDHWLVYTLFPENADIAAAPPPLLDEITRQKLALDALNERVYQFNKARTLADIKAEFVRAHRASAQAALALTEADVFDPSARSARIGRSVAELVFGIYEHYEEHAQVIETAFVSSS